MTGILQALLGSVSSAAAAATDAYFNLVTLLLPGNGTNGAQNNTFLDSGTANGGVGFTITRNPSTGPNAPTQGTFSPFSQTGWSNYFNGTDAFLTTPSDAAFAFGTGDFTLEAWVYTTSSSTQRVFSFGTVNTCELLLVNTGSNVYLNFYNGTTDYGSTSYVVPQNQWVHIAATRSSNNLRLFINGTLQNTPTSMTNNYSSNVSVYVGRYGAGSPFAYFSGYISNARITKGGALYTSSFTPSTTPLTTTVSAGTVSLLTCQSNRFIDTGTANTGGTPFTITVNGNPSVQAFSPFAPTAAYSAATVGGSGYFDGTGDYLVTSTTSAAFAYGTGDFTYSAWIYPTNVSGFKVVIDGRRSADKAGPVLYLSGATLAAAKNETTDVLVGGTVIANAWNFVELTRTSSNWRLFVNGSLTAGPTADAINYSANQLATVGANGMDATQGFAGYIADARVLKGTGGTSSTMPTSPLTAITNTSLLLNYTNAGITDATAKNDLETVGNAQISTAQSKFGGSSMYFDGTGDSLDINNTQLGIFSSGDFTIECWIYFNALPGSGTNSQIIDFRGFGVGTNVAPCLSLNNTSGTYNIRFESGSSVIADRSVSVSTGTWYHLAAVRSSGNVSIYWNGTISGTAFSLTTNYSTGYPVRIGAYTSSVSVLNGYIDDLRVTKFARYTGSTLTVPTAALPLQ